MDATSHGMRLHKFPVVAAARKSSFEGVLGLILFSLGLRMCAIFSIALLSLVLLEKTSAADTRPPEYWAKYLRAMKEPSIQSTKVAGSDFQFRFVWLRASHGPVAIRVWRHDGRVFCRSVCLEDRLDYSAGPIKSEENVEFTSEQKRKFLARCSTDDFWRPLNSEEEAIMNRFLGGAHWVFEIKDSSGYRTLDLFSPVILKAKVKRKGVDTAKVRDFQRYADIGMFLAKASRLPKSESRDFF